MSHFCLCNASILLSAALVAMITFATFEGSEAVPTPLKKQQLQRQQQHIFFAENPNSNNKKFWSPSSSSEFSGMEWIPQQQAPARMLMPYADMTSHGFISPYQPAGMGDRMTAYLVDEPQQFGLSKRGTMEGHFMDPSDGSAWLGEPSRLEWNFNRLRR